MLAMGWTYLPSPPTLILPVFSDIFTIASFVLHPLCGLAGAEGAEGAEGGSEALY